MSVFDDATDALFADPNFTVSASYTPPGGGSAVAVTIIDGKPETGDPSWGSVGFRQTPAAQDAAKWADVRKSELALPQKGGSLTIAGDVYPVIDVPELDRGAGLVWRLMLGRPA